MSPSQPAPTPTIQFPLGKPLPPRDHTEQVVQLALDFVRGLMQPAKACERNGFSTSEAGALLKNPTFQQLMRQLRAEWLDSANSAGRAQLRAGAALEDGIAQLYRLMHGQGSGPDGKISPVQVEAIKAMARIAGVGMTGNSGIIGPSGPAPQSFKLVFNFQNSAPETIEGQISQTGFSDDELEAARLADPDTQDLQAPR